MSLPHRHRSPEGGQGVPPPARDAIDTSVEAVAAGAPPPVDPASDAGERPTTPAVPLPHDAPAPWVSSRLVRRMTLAILAFVVGLGGAIWSLRTFESIGPRIASEDAPALLDVLPSNDLRPSSPLAYVQRPSLDTADSVAAAAPAANDRTLRTEGRGFRALSELAVERVEGSLGQNRAAPTPGAKRTIERVEGPIDATALVAVTPAPPAAAPSGAASSAPAEPAPIDAETAARAAEAAEETAVLETVQEYAEAFHDLDVSATAELWPTVDQRALSRAFSSLKAQEIAFDACDVALAQTTATARCHGTAQYVVKVGAAGTRTGHFEWLFRMRKVGDAWKIEGVIAWPRPSTGRDPQ